MSVPRVIHWWWDGPPVPPEYLRFRDRWQELHPGWSLEVWSEKRWLAEFSRHPVATFYTHREHWSKWAHEWGWKTNLARYAILAKYGGVWVDSDLEPLRPIDPLIERMERTPGITAMAAYEDRTYLNNAFLVSLPNGGFIRELVKAIPQRVRTKRGKPSNVATGPHFLTALFNIRRDLLALDRALIYPMHWSELDRREETFPAAYTLHHWHRKTEEVARKAALVSEQPAPEPTETITPEPTRHTVLLGTVKGGEVATRPSVRLSKRSKPTVKQPVTLPRRIRQLRGLTPENVMLALADFASQVPRDRAIVELGVYQGRTALTMAWGASQGAGAHVFAIDPWDLPGDRVPYAEWLDPSKPHRQAFTDPGTRRWAEYNVKALGYRNQITLLRAFSVDAGRRWSGAPVGMLFVDGDHRYPAVRDDLNAWALHLAPDAVIAFDDYADTHPEVIQAVDDMVKEGVLEPVKVYHDRLAVTRLATYPPIVVPEASTLPVPIEEVPLPEVPEEAYDSDAVALEDTPAPAADQPEELPAPAADQPEELPAPADDRPLYPTVRAGELEDVAEGTPLEELTMAQLRTVAQARGITLGREGKVRTVALARLRGE